MINKLHKEKNWQSLVMLILGFGASFLFLAIAMKSLPMGTAYAIWTGIGASGGAIIRRIQKFSSYFVYQYGFRGCNWFEINIVKRVVKNHPF